MSDKPASRASSWLRGRRRGPALYVALLLGLFASSATVGYVYQYHPTRDTVGVRLDAATPAPGPRTVAGTVTSVDGGRLVLATEGGPLTVSMPPGTPLDELQRAAAGLPAGARVNVGVLSTQYGLVLTGIVAIEGAR